MKWWMGFILMVLAMMQGMIAVMFLIEDQGMLRMHLNIPFMGQFEALCSVVMLAATCFLIFDKRKL